MKKQLVFVCLVFSVMSLYARGIQEDYRIAEEKARVSYAFGMILGSNLRTSGLEFDYNAFTEGLKTMMEDGKAQFSEMEAIEIIETALDIASERMDNENRSNEEEFLAGNRERPEINVTSSGLQYEIIVDTDGKKPDPDSIVRVNYTGTFIDGSQFDNSNEEEGAYIPLDRVIPGWTEGLLLMSEGSVYKFYIPSDLAYGKDGIQNVIPSYATLVFTVELLEIVNEDQPEEF